MKIALFSDTYLPDINGVATSTHILRNELIKLGHEVSAATALAAGSMRLTRNIKIRGLPVLGLLMPALWNALLVGWELTVYIGGGFLLNAVYVAIGEAVVLLVFGTALYRLIVKRGLQERLFFV